MESMLQPPRPFVFENNIVSVTSGNLSEEWRKWKNAFLICYEACELSKKDDKVQINILLHVIGEKCRDVYGQFGVPCKTLEEVFKKFDGFFLPKKNFTIERHKFFTREQGQSESVEQYVFELNKMAAKCEFKDLCKDLIRDRLICGLLNGTLRERLLREPDLTLQKAVEICSLAELSREHAITLKTDNLEHKKKWTGVAEIAATKAFKDARRTDTVAPRGAVRGSPRTQCEPRPLWFGAAAKQKLVLCSNESWLFTVWQCTLQVQLSGIWATMRPLQANEPLLQDVQCMRCMRNHPIR
ncbi:uncharacterized protein [Choristoneura fumiferana]|uniref:uncharacterized protein n=1 Tax=Choristoneura fumiferana TaxID=7141 RepID=UPI003D153F7F